MLWSDQREESHLEHAMTSGAGKHALAFIFVTALLGRLWCGWSCPYTVFLDHIFRRIERIVEGDAQARKKLAAAPWTTPKVIKRVMQAG